MKRWLAFLFVLVLLVAGVGFLGYQQGWIAPPTLTMEVTATTPDGQPLPGVEVAALGSVRGETDGDGRLSFDFERGVGEELTVSAVLSRPGFEFAPWEDRIVVRKWDRANPETMLYPVEVTLEPVAIQSSIRVEADGAPAPGASVKLDGEALGKTDENGALEVDLGDQISRTGKLSVRLKGYKSWNDLVTLQGDTTFSVGLSKIGVVYGSIRATYESLGRLVPLSGAEVVLAGKRVGTTDESGKLRIASPSRPASVEVTKDGFLPEPAIAKVKARSRREVVVRLFPSEAPVYRIAVLPPKNGKPGERDVDSALPEVEDRLSDYLFSYSCFERVDTGTFVNQMSAAGLTEEKILEEGWEGSSLANVADAVVASEVTKDNRIIVSVQVVSAKGDRLGAFAEIDKRSKIRSIAENASRKIVEIFPFEGHLLAVDGSNMVTSLGSGGDRGIKKGHQVTFYKLSAGTAELKPLGKGKFRSVSSESSIVEPVGDIADLTVGDKLVVLPRNKEAAFNASLALTVMAGREGSETPFADVNVYRDRTWVGITSEEGELEVPVASGDKHEFLFVRSGIAPYREDLEAEGRRDRQVVILPHTISRLRVESEPSGARVTLDGRLVGITPLDIDVPMGFRRIKIDGGEEWRVLDEVLELDDVEENFTGSRRFNLERDVLKQADARLAKDDVDGAIRVLSSVESGHTDFSAARNRLGGIYLDIKDEPAKAAREFERVLSRPENKELVNKRFIVTFLNLGRAYYLTGTPEGSEKAIPMLVTARDNKRFFPRDEYDRASHDTLYFLALASHKLYYARPSDRLLHDTARRWKDYFDFFPDALRNNAEVQQARAGAEHFFQEIQRKLEESQ